MPRYKAIKVDDVKEGNGNVLSGLGLTNAEQELIKARLTLQIARILNGSALVQAEAAGLLGIPQKEVAELTGNRPGSFAIRQLTSFLLILRERVAQSSLS